MDTKYLPIGTVVQLQGGSKKVMITGFNTEVADQNYDYNGCIFPEGFMEQQFCLFNRSQIEEILYMGLENEETEAYFEKISSILQNKNGTAGLTASDIQGNVTHTKRRVPKEPTNPLSSSEMKARYTKEKISGNQTKAFDFSKVGRE